MKQRSLTTGLTALALALSATATLQQSSHAQARDFVCQTSRDGIPTTYAITPQGKVPIIRWVYAHPGATLQERCETAAANFATANQQPGGLKYITTGIVNGQSVVCVANTENGDCLSQSRFDGVLFTLKDGENASRVLQQLRGIQRNALGPLFESSATEDSSNGAIDFQAFLSSTPTE
jgi:hypothetical protein